MKLFEAIQKRNFYSLFLLWSNLAPTGKHFSFLGFFVVVGETEGVIKTVVVEVAASVVEVVVVVCTFIEKFINS